MGTLQTDSVMRENRVETVRNEERKLGRERVLLSRGRILVCVQGVPLQVEVEATPMWQEYWENDSKYEQIVVRKERSCELFKQYLPGMDVYEHRTEWRHEEAERQREAADARHKAAEDRQRKIDIWFNVLVAALTLFTILTMARDSWLGTWLDRGGLFPAEKQTAPDAAPVVELVGPPTL